MADASAFALIFRLGLAMVVVIGVMFLAAGVLRRRGIVTAGRGSAGPKIDVVARRGLGRNAQVAIVRTGGRDFVVGVTEHQITLLSEHATPGIEVVDIDLLSDDDLEPDDVERADLELVPTSLVDSGRVSRPNRPGGRRTSTTTGPHFATPSQAWKMLLDGLRDRTTRR